MLTSYIQNGNSTPYRNEARRFGDDYLHDDFMWTENLLVSSMVWKGQ